MIHVDAVCGQFGGALDFYLLNMAEIAPAGTNGIGGAASAGKIERVRADNGK
jgi:hypothetical protein